VLKVIVDANVWIAALLNPGKPREIQQKLKENRYQLFFAEPLLAELKEVTARPKFLKKIQPHKRERLIRLIKDKATAIQLPSVYSTISRDPNDDMYLICANIAKVDFIVSGDPDLLSLGEYEGIKIITPAKFLKVLLKAQ